jgi:hypothetical protein
VPQVPTSLSATLCSGCSGLLLIDKDALRCTALGPESALNVQQLEVLSGSAER